MPSPGMRGWYVELDEELVKKFEEAFPDHGSKTLLTTMAVRRAVEHRLFIDAMNVSVRELFEALNINIQLAAQPHVHLAPGGDDVSRDGRRAESIDSGSARDNDDSAGTGDKD